VETPYTYLKAPDGIPTWITEEIIFQTIRVWQPYYDEKVSEQDAVEILMAFSRLLDIIATEAVEVKRGTK
jgi:hypothetical protein